MNLLVEGIEIKAVIRTDGLKKLVIDNIPQSHNVYRIRLDMLYYNEQNDRIATWISEYKTDNKTSEIDMSDKESYNSIIHKFITDSNKDLLKKTQTNIKLLGQQEIGVVLADGRVIDGNRRFTCLRNIQKENVETQYFDAVILDHNIKNNAKQIKMLELMLQHGTDEKVAYHPIDRLVGIYNDIVETELLTIKEYAKSVNQSETEIAIEVEKAKLLVEFLEFINAEKQFHIARNLNLVDPLKELYGMLKKITNEDQKEDLKNLSFAQLLTYHGGDTTRYMREIKKIASSNYLSHYLEENSAMVEKVCDEIEKYSDVSNKEISKIKSNEEIKDEFLHSTKKYVEKINSVVTRNKPAKKVEEAYESLSNIDQLIFPKLTEAQKNEVVEKLDMMEEIILEIRKSLDV